MSGTETVDFEAQSHTGPDGAAPSAAAGASGEAGPAQPKAERKWYHFLYKISWYQPYFDVDLSDVLLRLLAGVIPLGKGFFARVGDRPDIYGPFWLTTTLLFLLAIASNFASFVAYWWAGRRDDWEYDFYKLSIAAAVFYAYVAIAPLILWAVQHWWLKASLNPVHCWCIYGYTLGAFAIITPVCILPIEWVRWLVIILACAVSTLALVIGLWTPFKAQKVRALPVLAVVAALHVGLALVYKIYFFAPVHLAPPSSSVAA